MSISQSIGGLINVENGNVEKKLLEWNAFFEELIVDARTLTKDLTEGIRYTLGAGIIMILFGLLFLGYSIPQFWRGSLFVGLVLLATGADILVGLWNIWKSLQLRRRYAKLYELQREMRSS